MNLIKENSRFRFIWDLAIVILTLLSLAIIPYQFSFLHHSSTGLSLLIYLIDILFFIDIGLNFRTSYQQGGVDVIDPDRIKRNYLKGAFKFDIIANLPWELILIFWADTMVFGSSLFLVARFLRLFRIYRLFLILNRWQRQEWINSGLIRIAKFFVIAFFLIHFFSCSWFLSAFSASFPDNSWAVRENIHHAGPATQYLRSMYWTITTMTTVGYGDITPQRNIEYVISIIVMILGASLYAFIIGNVASLMGQLDSARVNFNNKLNSLTQFLRARQVAPELNARVKQYFDYVWSQHRGVGDDEFLRRLPKPLHLEVMQNLLSSLVDEIPLFKHSSPLLRNELLSALEPRTYPPNSILVNAGEVANEVYFLSKGAVDVYEVLDQTAVCHLETGDTFGDMSMLLNENRNVFVKSKTYCEVFLLSKSEFERIRASYPEFKEVIKQVAASRSDKITKLIEQGIVL